MRYYVAVKMNGEIMYWNTKKKKKNLQSIILGGKVRYRTVCRVYDFCVKIGENNIYVCIYSDIKSKYRKNTWVINNSQYLRAEGNWADWE